MKSEAVSEGDAEIATARVLPLPATFQAGSDPPAVAGEYLPVSPRERHGLEADPAARLIEELALCISPRMRDVHTIIAGASLTDVAVLITGETGTGKELVARALHYLGRRRHAPFLKVNCAAVARELLESELLGHEHGAFPGAHQLKMGKLEAASGGTIFLDEIGTLHPALQTTLLHIVEDGLFSRVGGRSNIEVDVRLVAATNRDLEAAVATGEFREDLFYRLNAIRIEVPPLRRRVEEIPGLANYFIQRHAPLFQREAFTLPSETLERLQQHSFPGNVRELENMVKRMIVMHDMGLARISQSDLRAAGPRAPKRAGKVECSLRDISRKAARAAEQDAIMKALEETRWNRLRAAKLLNISYRSLLYKIKEAGLDGKRKGIEPI